MQTLTANVKITLKSPNPDDYPSDEGGDAIRNGWKPQNETLAAWRARRSAIWRARRDDIMRRGNY